MLINKDLNTILRAGARITRETVYRENRAGMTLAICAGIGMGIFVVMVVMSLYGKVM